MFGDEYLSKHLPYKKKKKKNRIKKLSDIKQESVSGQVTSNIWNLITVDNVNTTLKATLESAKTSSTSQDLALNDQLCNTRPNEAEAEAEA